MNELYSVQHLPVSERPRERLLRHGPESMAISELIAILLGSGTKNRPVLQLAQELVVRFGTLQKLSEATIVELCTIKGLGQAKALQLKAALTLGQRLAQQTPPEKYKISQPLHAYNLVKEEFEQEHRELFMTILQDQKGCVISHHVVTTGALTSVVVQPREVFHYAIRHHAASVILVHNHPSGDPTPSPQDHELTKTLIEAGKVLGIAVHDHIIIGKQCYTSLRQQGFSFT